MLWMLVIVSTVLLALSLSHVLDGDDVYFHRIPAGSPAKPQYTLWYRYTCTLVLPSIESVCFVPYSTTLYAIFVQPGALVALLHVSPAGL